MQIIIVQAEIEQAIRNHILSQINIREGMEIDIDLRATRGEAGFQATINITPARNQVQAPSPGFVPPPAPAPAPVPAAPPVPQPAPRALSAQATPASVPFDTDPVRTPAVFGPRPAPRTPADVRQMMESEEAASEERDESMAGEVQAESQAAPAPALSLASNTSAEAPGSAGGEERPAARSLFKGLRNPKTL